MEHSFTEKIREILTQRFGALAEDIYDKSCLLQYLNLKTRSADRGSKSRSSFANLYAIYVLVEDYIANGYDKRSDYKDYEGAQFSLLFNRQRELPFGGKLQNHALNNRVNAEFQTNFPTIDKFPIIRDPETNRYWINENLLVIKLGADKYNIASSIICIIDEYVKVKQDSFSRFIRDCESLLALADREEDAVRDFIVGLLAPNVDARLFEIISYAILKSHYKDQRIFWGYSQDDLTEEPLKLYKTGRTNANDGGIDFVMRPLGRFFQVTETLDFKKYFLDIEKIERYPITFVIKSVEDVKLLEQKLRTDASKTYVITEVVNKYISCIEEIINIPVLLKYFDALVADGNISEVLSEVLLQSKVEFNLDEE